MEERILTQHVDINGYYYVTLSKNNRRKKFKVHCLVALMFIPNPENKPEVNHKFGIKTDNRASELEWNTKSENILHSYKLGLHKPKKGREHTCSKSILQYSSQGVFIKEWGSIRETARQLNICPGNIIKCCKGKKKSAGGYMWRYKN